MGEEMTDNILTTGVYIQENKNNDNDHHANNDDDKDGCGGEEVRTNEITNAYAYVSDLIPMEKFDLEVLKLRSPPSLAILGYVSIDHLPRRYTIRKPYSLAGDAS